MEKNWLIRTKTNHILGPISKEKVVELYKNGSIQPDDEVCSGNGYWFYAREQNLVQKFLIGNESQSFNPLSESSNIPLNPNEDIENQSEGSTLITNFQASSNKVSTQKNQNENESHVKLDQSNEFLKDENLVFENETKENSSQDFKNLKGNKKQIWLKYLGFIGFILLFFLIYFRKSILHQFFQQEISLNAFDIVQRVYAEDVGEKKKV